MSDVDSAKLSVDIWSDIACPWCFIGKRRFEKAVEEFGADRVDVTFHSFELAPDTPADFAGSEIDFLVKHKGMDTEQVRKMLGQVTTIAASEGLNYDFDSLQHTNTVLAHQALHFAKGKGKQAGLKERLLAAYFEEGRHVGRVDELVALGEDVGLDGPGLRDALESGVYLDAVEQDVSQAQALGVSGVPFFVINNKYGVSGAQESQNFLAVLNQIADEEQ